MAAIQNLKNILRHGKQARAAPPTSEATTNVSNVHAEPQRYHQDHKYGISEPNIMEHQPLQHPAPHQADYSAAAVNNQNVAAKAGDAAARAAGDKHKRDAAKEAGSKERKEYDASVLERIVAEERESKGKLPRYPGLERWALQEKMGDGAFSNVYRARDTQGQYGEVAIKVVRKFEMNSTQVCITLAEPTHPFSRLLPSFSFSFHPSRSGVGVLKSYQHKTWCRVTSVFIPTLRRLQKPWRCGIFSAKHLFNPKQVPQHKL